MVLDFLVDPAPFWLVTAIELATLGSVWYVNHRFNSWRTGMETTIAGTLATIQSSIGGFEKKIDEIHEEIDEGLDNMEAVAVENPWAQTAIAIADRLGITQRVRDGIETAATAASQQAQNANGATEAAIKVIRKEP